MKRNILLSWAFVAVNIFCTSALMLAQQNLTVEGAIEISMDDATATPGTIRWTGADFEGYIGSAWVSLTGKNLIGTVEDGSSITYTTIKIGGQEWMTENLKTTNYNDGQAIPNIISGQQWTQQTTGAYCDYDNISGSGYGRLYNWYAIETGKLCPVGWQVATETDWDILTENFGGDAVAGAALKEIGTEHWTSPNVGATNLSGLFFLPAGTRDGTSASFGNLGVHTRIWTGTEVQSNSARIRNLSNHIKSVGSDTFDKRNGFSVRCINRAQ